MKDIQVIYNLPNDFYTAEELKQPVIIRSYQSNRKSPRNKSIIHQNMIDILISGKKTIIDAGGTKSFEAGELMILSKGNSIISQALPDNNLFHSVVIYFTNDVFGGFMARYSQLLNVGHHGRRHKNSFLTYSHDTFISNYINALQILLQTPHIFTAELKLLKLEELLLYLLNQDVEKLLSLAIVAKDNDEMKLRQVAESSIGGRMSLEELAFLCNTSLSSFKRKFYKMYGASPQKWLLQQKMQLAANLLKHPGETPGSVYEKVGYEDHSSFSKAFKRQFKLTPKAFQVKI